MYNYFTKYTNEFSEFAILFLKLAKMLYIYNIKLTFCHGLSYFGRRKASGIQIVSVKAAGHSIACIKQLG